MSHPGPVRPLCPHFRPESCWPVGSSSLSVNSKELLRFTVCFLVRAVYIVPIPLQSPWPEDDTSHPHPLLLRLQRGKEGPTVIRRHGKIRKCLEEAAKQVFSKLKVDSLCDLARKSPASLKEAFALVASSCVTLPRHLQVHAARAPCVSLAILWWAESGKRLKGGKDWEGGELCLNVQNSDSDWITTFL